MKWLRFGLFLMLGAMGLAGAPEASAGAQCSILGSGLSFGDVDIIEGTAETPVGYIEYQCEVSVEGQSGTKTVAVKMCVGLPDAPSDRIMSGPVPHQLTFDLYKDPNRTEAWGNTAPTHLQVPTIYATPPKFRSTATVTGTLPVYGRVPPQPDAVVGYYSRSLVATLRYGYEEGDGTQLDCLGNGGEGSGVENFLFAVDATVPPSCAVLAADPKMDFGTLTGIRTGTLTSAVDISLECTNRTAWQLGLDDGKKPAGDGSRQMCTADGTCIRYQLSRPQAYGGGRWGDSAGIDTVDDASTGGPQTVTVSGAVPDQPLTRAGAYTDTVLVLLTY